MVGKLGEYLLNFDSKRVPVSGTERSKRKGAYPYHGAAGIMDYIDDYLFEGIYALIGEDGSVIRENGLAVTQYVWGKFWANNHAHVLQGRGGVSTEQLYLYFHFETVAPYVTGAVQPKLSQGRMNEMPFLFAGDAVCSAFARLVSPLFAFLRANADCNNSFVTMRDALLPKLLSGEIRINLSKFLLEK
jgi:type I restriction enzyme S subunit